MKRESMFLGADPECFVEHGNGKPFPAFEFLTSKYEPGKTEDGQNFYWDGFQAEFNIAASPDIAECLKSIRGGLKAVLLAAKKKDPTARLSSRTVIESPIEVLEGLPIEYKEFGCMPSYNIYDISGQGADGITCPYRFAGGHIHFGIGRQSDEMIANIVRSLDAILGVACVSLFENFDNPIRRRFYGLVGEFRLPPHGIEYRTLSDSWIFSPITAHMVLDFARKIVANTLEGRNDWNANVDEVVETVLLSDVDKARAILERNMPLLKQMEIAPEINLMLPIEKSIVGFSDIAKNWGI